MKISLAQISGCTDPQSTNYNPLATINDGSCVYPATNLALTDKTALSTPLIDETSGLSNINGKIWTFCDSGNPHDIYRVDSLTNTIFQTVHISNATNVDWEDMTTSNDYLFIGDFGNNNGNRQDLKIYRVNKSDLTSGATSVTAAIINFSFSDQTSFPSLPNASNFDCESMLFLNDSIHLFSKNWIDKQTRHYVLANSPGTRIAQYRETYNAGFLVTSATIQNTGVIALCGYIKDGTKAISMCMIYDYKNNLLFNGNKRKFDLSTLLVNGQVEGVEFFNGAYGYVTNERYTSGANVPPKLKSFNLSPYLPAAFLTPKPLANFTASAASVCQNASVAFTDQSSRTPTSWQWSFPGGTPSTSTLQNPQIQYSTAGSYPVTLIAGNTFGYDTLIKTNFITVNALPSASISPGGPVTFCAGSSVTLNANAGAGLAYQWKNNTVNISGATASTFVANASGSYTCSVTNSCGNAASNALIVTVNPQPTASISAGGATTFCSGGSVTLNANTGSGLTWQWKNNTVNISGATSSSYVANASGSFTCGVTNNCSSAASNAITVTVNALPTASISANGATAFCTGGNVTLSANTGAGLTWQWKNNSVNISGATASSYLVNAAGNFTCSVTNSCSSAVSNSISVAVNTLPSANITANGPTSFCSGNSVILNANTGAGLTYQWKNNTVNISGATVSSYVSNATGNYTCTVTNSCGSLASNSISVIVDPSPAAIITSNGPLSFCAGSTVMLNANTAAGLSYQWKNNTVNISGATSSSYVVNASGSYTCSVSNGCGTASSNTISVTVDPSPSANITANGPTSFCAGNSVTLNVNTGAGLIYQWRYNTVNIAGASTSSYVVSGTGSYDCNVSNSCGNIISNVIVVTVDPLPAANITANGPTNLCSGASVNLVANTGAGLSYQWKNNTANISGATASSYMANIDGAYTCNVTNGCGALLSNEIAVSVGALLANPAIPAGNEKICKSTSGNVYSVSVVNGATTYTWSAPAGATISSGQGTNSISISYGSTAVSGNICVFVSNSCGNSGSSCIPVTVVTSIPVKPASISGSVLPCNGSVGVVYACPLVSNATSYNWSVPSTATIAGGQGTNSISVNFNSTFTTGSIKVASVNCVGSSVFKSLSVQGKPAIPGLVTGQVVGTCAGANNISYSIAAVAGALGYNWTAPANASIASGQGTTNITVNFSATFSTGTLSVTANNACGVSSVRNTTIRSSPVTPGTITGGTSACANQTGVSYSIAAVSGATNYNWLVPAGAIITAGQNSTTIVVNFGTAGGTVKVNAGNACGNSTYRSKTITMNCRELNSVLETYLDVAVYPNPGTNHFTLLLNSQNTSKINFILRDLEGREIERKYNLLAGENIEFGHQLTNGIYIAEVSNDFERKIIRVIKQD
ncbi:MAG: PKD domain-containing protein [Bacteroidota bacterium]